MQRSTTFYGLASVFGAVALLAGTTAGPGTARAAEINYTCAHDQPTTPGSEGVREVQWQTFKKLVEERSKGRIAVKVVGGGQLGDMPQIVENLKLGTIDCTSVDAATSGPHIPPYSFIGVPYVIESEKHRDRLVDENGPLFKEINKLVMDYLKSHAMGSEQYAPRSIYTRNKAIKTPDDLKGVKLRTMQSPAQVKSWQTLGANATALAFGEIYAALQTGVIDGAENQPMFLWNMKHYEQIKYYSMTNHMMNIGVLVLTDRAMSRTPADLRPIVVQAGKEAAAAGRKYDVESDAKFLDMIKKAGIQVVPVDTAPFVAKLKAVHDDFAKELKAEGLLKIIREEGEKAKKS